MHNDERQSVMYDTALSELHGHGSNVLLCLSSTQG